VSRPPIGTVAVVLLLVLGTAVGASARPAHRARAAGSSVEVVGATVVCPELRQREGVLATRVSVGSGLLPAGQRSAGGSVAARLLTKPATAVALPATTSGQVAFGVATHTQDGLVVSATGDIAVVDCGIALLVKGGTLPAKVGDIVRFTIADEGRAYLIPTR